MDRQGSHRTPDWLFVLYQPGTSDLAITPTLSKNARIQHFSHFAIAASRPTPTHPIYLHNLPSHPVIQLSSHPATQPSSNISVAQLPNHPANTPTRRSLILLFTRKRGTRDLSHTRDNRQTRAHSHTRDLRHTHELISTCDLSHTRDLIRTCDRRGVSVSIR